MSLSVYVQDILRSGFQVDTFDYGGIDHIAFSKTENLALKAIWQQRKPVHSFQIERVLQVLLHFWSETDLGGRDPTNLTKIYEALAE